MDNPSSYTALIYIIYIAMAVAKLAAVFVLAAFLLFLVTARVRY